MCLIGLIACVASKQAQPAPARELYTSPLFQKARAYVEPRCDRWFILSALYGVVKPDEEIEPYDLTLLNMRKAARQEWSSRCWARLEPEIRQGDTIIMLAGLRYREHLVPMLTQAGCTVKVPMEGLMIGEQLQWLNNNTQQPNTGNI